MSFSQPPWASYDGVIGLISVYKFTYYDQLWRGPLWSRVRVAWKIENRQNILQSVHIASAQVCAVHGG